MRKVYLLLLFTLCSCTLFAQKITISGFVREKGSQEILPYVSVRVPALNIGTSANAYGFFSLTIPSKEQLDLEISQVGYQVNTIRVSAQRSQQITVELSIKNVVLEEVKVNSSQQEKLSEQTQMSLISLPVTQVKAVPAFLGEKDVLKTLQLFPGIQKGREGSTGLYVRGGGPDQNLLILDDATVYNANHLFGFFSVFNGDALKSIEMTKGGFPARYGGRLSSVIDMQMKEGNKEKLAGEFGIGLLSSRLTLEGPLKKEKASFLIAARRTYADALLRPISGGEFPNMYFYDLNMKVNYDLGSRDKLYLSGYLGRDAFSSKEQNYNYATQNDNGFNWGNTTTTLRWNHLFNEKLFSNTSLIFTNFDFKVFNTEESNKGLFSYQYESGIRDFSLKTDFDYLPSYQHSIKAGFLLTAHRFSPKALVLKDTRVDTSSVQSTQINALESAVYVEDLWRITEKLSINAGLRLSHFSVNQKNYLNLEPRFSAAYKLPNDAAIKASFARMNQYIHLLSNSGLGLPTDLWVSATDRVPPQTSQQVALGYVKDFSEKNFSLSIEGYFKQMNNIIGYKQGASFLLLDVGPDPQKINSIDWQENVTSGQGKAYGLELMLQRKTGRLTGWIAYTLSKVTHQFAELNDGKEFLPRYDRRHDISIVGIYQLKPMVTVSATWVYGSGNHLSVPIAEGNFNGLDHTGITSQISLYDSQNAFQAAAYHRLDLAMKFSKKKKHGERAWEIGVYNAYNRVNPFYYQINQVYDASTRQLGDSKLYRKGLFPIVPSITYSFKF